MQLLQKGKKIILKKNATTIHENGSQVKKLASTASHILRRGCLGGSLVCCLRQWTLKVSAATVVLNQSWKQSKYASIQGIVL